jgi:hypothetical protein
MMRRTTLLRGLTLVWAGVQLATPVLGSVADARLAAGARDPVAHVESTTSSTCPVIHAPDCGLCRYLSSVSAAPDTPCAVALITEGVDAAMAARHVRVAIVVVLPDGRAPPSV